MRNAHNWPTSRNFTAFSFLPERNVRLGSREERKNTCIPAPPRSSFPRGWSSRRVTPASNLTKLHRAISRRSVDVTVRIPDVSFFRVLRLSFDWRKGMGRKGEKVYKEKSCGQKDLEKVALEKRDRKKKRAIKINYLIQQQIYLLSKVTDFRNYRLDHDWC